MASSSFPDTALVVDRFLSATSPDDVIKSLETLHQGLQQGHVNPSDLLDTNSNNELHAALVKVLAQATNTTDTNDSSEEAPTWVARIYQTWLQTTNDPQGTCAALLTTPQPGLLVETLVDVSTSNSSSNSTFTKVVCLQVLHQLAQFHVKLTQTQLLQATNGLHRLGMLLDSSTEEGTTDLAVRQQAVLLAQTLATWPSVAKVWVFLQLPDKLMHLALPTNQQGHEHEDDLLLIHDCLQLVQSLLQHDTTSAELVFGESNVVAAAMAHLLDLRNAQQFRHPELIASSQKKQQEQQQPPLQKKKRSKQPATDDLDDLLQTTKKDTATTSTDDTTNSSDATDSFPHLIASEEANLMLVLDILVTALENDRVRHLFIGSATPKHATLSHLLWELALVAPPSTPQAACALPSVSLQQAALHLVALYLSSDPQLLQQHSGLDRLLYLVCTGGLGQDKTEKLSISLAALHVLRQSLTPDQTHEILLATVAPPLEHDQDPASSSTPEPTAVQKLLNTLFDNLHASQQQASLPLTQELFLAGALGGLGLFLDDEASKALLLKVAPHLVDDLLVFLTEQQQQDVVVFVWRFLSQWIYGAPTVAQAVLQSPHSPILSSSSSSSSAVLPRDAYAALVLGLTLEYMGDDESLCGGWTRSGMVQSQSLSVWTRKLEAFKQFSKTVPWRACRLEYQTWHDEYQQAVLIVRKRLVRELTSNAKSSNDDQQQEPDGNPLQTLLEQQTTELERLRQQVAQQEKILAKQGMYMIYLFMMCECCLRRHVYAMRRTTCSASHCPLCFLQRNNWPRGKCAWRVHRRNWTKCSTNTRPRLQTWNNSWPIAKRRWKRYRVSTSKKLPPKTQRWKP